jgi:hypothetical protein
LDLNQEKDTFTYYQKVVNEEKGEIYEGKLDNNGNYHKDGMIFYDDLSIFKGEFKHGFKIKGIEYFNNNDVYEGQYKNNIPNYKGKLINKRL